MSQLDALYLRYRDHPDPDILDSLAIAVHDHVLSISHDDDLADDLVVTVLTRLQSSGAAPFTCFSHWLSKTVRYRLLDRHKARSEADASLDGLDIIQTTIEPPVVIPDAVQGLDRRICDLMLDGYHMREVAAEVGLRYEGLRSRLRRLKVKLSDDASSW